MLSLIHRMKDRKLAQWALAYLAGAWVFLEAAGHVGDHFHWPGIVQRVLIILAGLGFFLVLVFAWYHGEQGRQRVSGPELLMVAALLVVAGVALATLSPDAGGPPEETRVAQLQPLDDRPGIAVLLCDDFSPDPADAYLALGLHDEILNRLSKISSLRSVGRTSVRQFAEDLPDTHVIAGRLGVGFVGECSVTKIGDRIRLTFQLLEGSSGTQLWSENFDHDFTVASLLVIYTEIAERVALGVGATLTPEELNRIQAKPTNNLLAYELYQRGRARWASRTREGIHAAIELFEAAIAEDSTFAQAYAGLAQAHLILPYFDPLAGSSPSGRGERVRELATQSLALDPDQPLAHAAVGYHAFLFDWDWGLAERELRLALALDPGDSQARGWLADVLITLGRHDEALVEATRAAQADPASIAENSSLALALWNAGDVSGAERQFRHLMNLDGGTFWGWGLGAMLEQEGRFEEANNASLQSFRASYPLEVVDSLEVALKAVWDPTLRERGVSVLRFLEGSIPEFGLSPPVSWYASIGDMDEAVAAARRAIESRSVIISQFNWAHFRSAQADPRFLAILEELGLPKPQ
jgi:TolB-like protein/Flp pilus assembly protein TadD